MTKNEIIITFLKKSVLPIVIAMLLFCVGNAFATKDGVTDYMTLFIICGMPFGVHRMFFWLVPHGGSLGFTVGIIALNFIVGGIIGGFILMWRLAIAIGYIPLSIYRFVKVSKTVAV